MPMSVAEVYMLALRKSLVPIVGEAVPHPFDFQIELDSWTWNLTPPELEQDKKKGKDSDKDKSKDKAPKSSNGPDQSTLKKQDEDILRAIDRIQKDESKSQVERNRLVLDRVKKAQTERRKDVDDAGSDDETDKKKDEKDRFTFTFEKNVDLATTQLLNAMKAGEVLPRIVLSVIHRANHAPLTLIITFKNVTLTSYKLNVEVSDTMADLKESWEAKFEMMDYVYANRPGSGGIPGVTQGTARVFKMNLLRPDKWV
jgi:type VI protein secretion system component Hcp